MLKKIFRNGSLDLLVIISFVLAFIILLYLMPLIHILIKIQNRMDGYDYEKYYQVQFTKYSSESITDLSNGEQWQPALTYNNFIKFTQEVQAISDSNIYLYVSIDFTKDVSFYTGKVLLKSNEEILEKFQNAEEQPACVISSVLEEYQDGETITIGDVQYSIDGYLEKSEEQICAFYLNFSALNELQREYLLQEMYQSCMKCPVIFYLGSEEKKINAAERFVQLCRTYGADAIDITEEITSQIGGQKDIYHISNKYALVLCLILAIVNCINVSALYVKRKTREYAVRKACGYTNFEVLLLNMKNMGKDFCIALPLGAVILQILEIIEKKVQIVSCSTGTLLQMISAVAGLLLIYVLTQYFVLKNIMKIEPDQMIQSQVQ